jgi:hypothetical protein
LAGLWRDLNEIEVGRHGREKTVREDHWANNQRAQVNAEIQALLCNAAEGEEGAEVVGLLPVQDRLDDLRRRLAQIESLIRAAGEEPHESETAWPPELDDPRLN